MEPVDNNKSDIGVVVTVKNLAALKSVIAAGLEHLGYIGIDIETIKFNSECDDRGFNVSYFEETQPKFVKSPGVSTLEKELKRR